jgi:hypothetical protein
MKLLITTQIYENYGAHEWDGKGECPQYWKAKGGMDYAVRGIKNSELATMAVMSLRDKIEQNNEYYRESIIGWDLVSNDYLTDFEKSQLEHEGKIRFSPKELEWA